MSEQAQDEAVTSLNAAKAAVDAAPGNVAAAQASLKVALANTIQAAGRRANRRRHPRAR